jgi:hypothetical protein
VIAAAAEAQINFTCPGGPSCVNTGNWCAGQSIQFVWPTDYCGCSIKNFYYVYCSGSLGGAAVDCCMASCAPTTWYDTVCPVVPEPSPAGPGKPNPAKPLICPRPSSSPSPPPAPSSAGNPVSVTTGTMFFSHTDGQVGELSLTRTFDSSRVSPSTRYGAFGPGWNSSFDLRLNLVSTTTIEARLVDGGAQYFFDDNADGVYQAVLPYSSET